MAEWIPRSGQDLNQIYSNTNLALSTYSNSNGINYLHSNSNLHYQPMGSTYPTYSATYIHNAPSSVMYLPPSQLNMSYHMSPPRSGNLPSQPRTLPQNSYYVAGSQSSRHSQQAVRYHISHVPSEVPWVEIEEQESENSATQASEPFDPPLDGYPDVKEFDSLMTHYVKNLSPKKQDKALIHAARAANIKAVLIDKKTTSVESAQFRFWVKKMFTLYPNDSNTPARKKKICHDSKPVAVREKLFKILTRAHKLCQHGGRDKTSAQVRKVYSWVPKELISRFVKICPTCQVRRGTSRGGHEAEKSPEPYVDPTSPDNISPAQRFTDMVAGSHSIHPLHAPQFSMTFQQQNRWMTSIDPSNGTDDKYLKYGSLSSSSTSLQDPGGLSDHAASNIRPRHRNSQGGYQSIDPGETMDLATPTYTHSHRIHDYHPEEIEYRLKSGRAF